MTVDTVWVRGIGDELIRADSIVVLEQGADGLRAECISGRSVRLTDTGYSRQFQLALLEEIRQAASDERWPVVIMADTSQEAPVWTRERVDTLIGRL